MGGLCKVPAGGGTAEVVASGLPMPGGIAVAADGTVYVSTCAVCPGAGSIASYKPGMLSSHGRRDTWRRGSMRTGRAATPGPFRCHLTVRVPNIPACRCPETEQ